MVQAGITFLPRGEGMAGAEEQVVEGRGREGEDVCLPSLPCPVRMPAALTLGRKKTTSIPAPWDLEQIRSFVS